MQVGCGFRIKRVKGRDYVYFWRYESRGEARRQVQEYMGPRASPGTAERLARALEAYYSRASDDLRRDLVVQRRTIAALHLRA